MDKLSVGRRSAVMAQVRSYGNRSTELALIRFFRLHHVTGWRRRFPLAGKPDFVFPGVNVAVFVDGCFWHGCPEHCRLPGERRHYWEAKIQGNSARDARNTKFLRAAGWTVMRIWEHELTDEKMPSKVRRLKRMIEARSA